MTGPTPGVYPTFEQRTDYLCFGRRLNDSENMLHGLWQDSKLFQHGHIT